MAYHSVTDSELSEFLESLESDELVTIATDESRYKVQRTLLEEASPWFTKALDDRFKEGQNRVLRFPGTHHKTITFFLHWLFTGRVPFFYWVTVEQQEPEVDREQMLIAVRVWIFADAHFMPKLQNVAMKFLHELVGYSNPDLEVVREIYQTTSAGSLLRKLIIARVVGGLRQDSKDDNPAGCKTHELESLEGITGFTADLAAEFLTYSQKEDRKKGVREVSTYLVDEEE